VFILINYIKGKVVDVTQNSIIVENNGIGYEIFVPLSVIDRAGQAGNEIKIYTYMHVREDLLQLFGFLDKDGLEVFKLLITVSGIGPKGALGILGVMSASDLKFAVLAGDAKTISKAPGIGAKTAGKLILELKDKMRFEDIEEELSGGAVAGSVPASGSRSEAERQMISDAAEALAALGYSPAEALKAVRKAGAGTYSTVEELLKLGLKNI